jgi:23S rRNA (cytidine1920-2'-O)/16S rRNA (cytidine1409-2'-O)-methyltransferase
MDRLDSFLVKSGLVESRNKALELIRSGYVQVDNKVCTKASLKVTAPSIKITEKFYVSRAGKKLDLFFDTITYDAKSKSCLDIGASTGGFVQVLLERGAKEVYAVDVGKGQLHASLRNDARVFNFEGCDIRDFQIKQTFDLVTCDLSFISVSHVLPSILHFAHDEIVVLFKPQFEVGKNVKRDRKGVVQDTLAIDEAVKNFEALIQRSCTIIDADDSKLKGKEGNLERFYRLKKD